MELKDSRELILALKEAKKQQEITIPRLIEMLQANNQTVARTTLVRLFADGSEDNDGFNYTSTLKPVADILLGNDQEQEDIKRHLEIVRLQSEIRVKDEAIITLNNQIDSLLNQIEQVRSDAANQMEFLHNQIKLKDKRMDTKDELIQRVMDRNDKKDKAIAELMEENKQLDQTIRQLMDRCKLCDKEDKNNGKESPMPQPKM